jgi:hypothetical protein
MNANPQGKGKPNAKQPGSEQQPDSQQQEAASGAGEQYGEGSYKGTRQYNEGLKEHVQNHDIEKEARDAAPRSPEEEREMNAAEEAGRSRARGAKPSPDAPEDDQESPK